MRKNIFLILFSFVSVCFAISCSSSVGTGGCDTERISNFSTDIFEKAEAYILDPSTENCLNYRSILEDYLDELDKCDTLNEAEIEEARADLEELEC